LFPASRDSEVRIAIHTLRNNSWVEEKEIKEDGKGQPMKVYRLTIFLDSIIKHFKGMRNAGNRQRLWRA